jgi:hypothetical protein
MTLKEESVIEMIALQRPRRILVAIFHDSDFYIQKMSYHTGSIQRDVTEERNQKKKRTSDKRINSKQ